MSARAAVNIARPLFVAAIALVLTLAPGAARVALLR